MKAKPGKKDGKKIAKKNAPRKWRKNKPPPNEGEKGRKKRK